MRSTLPMVKLSCPSYYTSTVRLFAPMPFRGDACKATLARLCAVARQCRFSGKNGRQRSVLFTSGALICVCVCVTCTFFRTAVATFDFRQSAEPRRQCHVTIGFNKTGRCGCSTSREQTCQDPSHLFL